MKIKVAAIGLGRIWSAHKSAIQNLSDDFDLVATVDIKKPADFVSYQAMLKSVKPDLVSICTPNYTHFEIAEACLSSGANVIIEKPMTIRDYHASRLLEVSKETGKKIFPVLQVRYNEAVVALLNTLPKLGKIYFAECRVFWSRPQSYYDQWMGDKDLAGSGMLEIGIHYIDIFRQVIGDFIGVRTYHSTKGHITRGIDDMFSAQFDLQTGLAFFHFSTCVKEKNMECSITVIGEHGSIKIGGKALDIIEFWNVEGVPEPTLSPPLNANNYGNYQGSCPNHEKIYKNVAEVLLRNGRQEIPPEEAIKTINLIKYLYEKRRKSLSLR